MADETLSIVVRLRNALRAAAEMHALADSVDDVGRKSEKTNSRLSLLDKAAGNSSKRMGGLASNLNNVSGRLKLAAAGAVVAGPPLLAIASSAAGAAAGLGLMGGAAAVAAAVGFGGLYAVGKQAVGQLTKVRSAQYAYNVAVQEYGKWSTQAIKAQAKLNAVIAQAGGGPVRRLVTQLDAVSSRWRRLTAPARASFFTGLGAGLKAANGLLPTFARQTNATAATVGRGMAGAFAQLGGSEQRHNLRVFGDTFRRAFSPALAGGVNVVIVLLRYLRQATPFVVQAARGFLAWSAGLRAASTDGARVQGTVRTLVKDTRAWWALLVAVGHLAVAVFHASDRSGRGLVRTLTHGVDRLTAWVTAANQSGASQSKFQQWSGIFRTVFSAVGQLVSVVVQLANAALPGLQSGSGAVHAMMGLLLLRLQILTSVIQFLGPLTGPLIVAFTAWKVATIALTAATTLLNIAFRLTPLGWIVTGIALVIAAVVLMWNHWAGFRNFIQGAWAWIKTAASDTWSWVAHAIGDFVTFMEGVPSALSTIWHGMWDGLKGGAKAAINFVIGLYNKGFSLINSITPGALKVPGLGTVIPAIPDIPMIPLLAQGGRVQRRGRAVVGDRGPEVLDLPRGAVVTPLDRSGAGGRPRGPVWLPVHIAALDGRVMAEVVVDVAEALAARA